MTTPAYRYRPLVQYTNFIGLSRKTDNAAKYGFTEVCPRCDGFGAYNRQYDNLMERYDTGFCAPCNGWGYRDPATTCGVHPQGIHLWENERVIGKCLRRYTCACGRTHEVDSSG